MLWEGEIWVYNIWSLTKLHANSCQEKKKKEAAAKNVTYVGSLHKVSLHYLLLHVGLEEIFH